MRNLSRAFAIQNLFGPITYRNLWRLVSSAVLIGAIGCSKPQDAQTLISDARRYQAQGDNKAAIIQLKNALQQNPDDSEARYLLGTIYTKSGDLESAEKELRKALSLGLSPAQVLPELGQALLALGQFQRVLDETKQLSEGKNSAEISTLRGNALLALGKAQEAKDQFEQALKEKPNFSHALIGLAKYSLLTQDVEDAIRFGEQAVTQNPEEPDAWLFKGDLLRVQGKVDPALAAYDQVVKLKPNSAPAYINKAFLEIGAGKFDAAQADIDAARKVTPRGLMVFYTQALLDFNRGKPRVALESLQQVLRTASDHGPSLLLAGAVQLALGSAPQAEQHLKQYLEKDPKNIYARKLLASVLLKNSQTQRAITVLTPALTETQQDPQLFSLAGESYMQLKDFAKATEYFEKASNIAPASAKLHTALSISRLGQGDAARAVAELEMATKLDPKSSQAGILLTMTHLRRNETDKALSTVKTLEKENPYNPLIQNLKGGVYLSKKDTANARSSFEKALSLQSTYFPAVMNLAQLDLQEGKSDSAKKRFEAVLEKDKKNIQAMTALSRLAFSQGRNEEATDWLERASQEDPGALQPAIALATHYLRSGEEQKSLTLAKILQGSHPNNPAVLELLATAQEANNDKTASLESYNKLAAMLPESALAQYRIASIHLSMENVSAASDALKKALTIKPDYLEAQLAQIMLEARRSNYDRGIELARQIQKQRPKSPAGYVAEGDLLMAQKHPERAIRAYEQAFFISKNQPILVKLHASLSKAGKGKEANTHVIHWLKDHPSDVAIRMYLAEVYLLDRRNQSAIEQYQIILRQNPKFVPALNNLATSYQKERDPRALEYAEKAYDLAGDKPSIMDTLGLILVERGDIERGLPLLQKAVFLAPEVAEIRYHFALGLVRSGEKAKARKELEQLISTGKNFSHVDEATTLLVQIQ